MDIARLRRAANRYARVVPGAIATGLLTVGLGVPAVVAVPLAESAGDVVRDATADAVSPDPTPDAFPPAAGTADEPPAARSDAVTPRAADPHAGSQVSASSADLSTATTAPAATDTARAPQVAATPSATVAPLAINGTQPICTAGYVYSVTPGGQLQEVAPSGAVTAVGTAASNVSGFNGLGIGSGGTTAFAVNRSRNVAIGTIYSYNTSTGAWTSTGVSTGDTGTNLVGGAVDLSTGSYYFGGFTSTGAFRLYQYTPGASAVVFRGTIATGATTSTNGDIAFDAAGNLFIVRGDGATSTVVSVTRANLAAASGGTVPSSIGQGFATMENVNGIAFDASGRAFLGSGTTLRSYTMPSFTQSPAGNITTGLGASTDLATCSSPPTITIEKVVEGGRNAATDQFQLSLSQGTTSIGSATTAGSTVGLQNERIGPVPTGRNVALSFSEAAAGTTVTSRYATTWQCSVDGVQTSSGTGTAGTITTPLIGQSVVCQFRNAPLGAQVNITKQVTDGRGLNPQPRAGWTVSSAITASTGSVSASLPVARQTAASGTATWDHTFGTTASRGTVTVGESMQPGFVFQSGQCVLTRLDGTTETTTLAGPGDQQVAGVAPGDRLDCSYVNRPAPGTLGITKAFDPSVPQGSGSIGFTGTYTCTLSGATVASGTWSVTGAGSAVLVPAAGTPAPNAVPPGASCTATEVPPSGSQGLPNDSYVWGAPQIGPAVTISSGGTSTVTVTNTATRVYGGFRVTKVVPAGSVVDPGSTFSGGWSCALGSEVVTGTWGPIAAGATWTSPSSAPVPRGASCSVTSETRADRPVANDPSYAWAGDPVFSAPVAAVTTTPSNVVTVTNATVRTLGSVVWSKVDGAGTVLSGSEWLLTGPGLPSGGLTVTDCVAAASTACTGRDVDPSAGGFRIADLLWGDYELRETRAPAGYVMSPTVQRFTIGSATGQGGSTAVDLGRIINAQRTPPTLPLTGGLGSDGFAIAGGGLVAVAATALLVARRKRVIS